MAKNGKEDELIQEKKPKEALIKSKYKSHRSMTTIEASDEIISIFCELHGGIEAAMPMIIHQFKRANVDFANPTKDGLIKVAEGLVKVTEFLKGKAIAEKEEKRFSHIIKTVTN